ncbi:autotransporter, partial [Pandoraea sp. NPDC090278]
MDVREVNVSADDNVVTWTNRSGTSFRTFRWTLSGGAQDLGGVTSSDDFSIGGTNTDGSVVVGAATNGSQNQQAFRWTAAKGIQFLNGFPAGTGRSLASAVSGDGQVIVGLYRRSDGYELAYRWTVASGFQDLGARSYSSGTGANDDGSVVVGFYNDTGPELAFRWTAGTGITSLGVLSGDNESRAYAVSGDGKVVVGTSTKGTEEHAFRWTESANTLEALGTLGGKQSWAYGISRDGKVIVGSAQKADATWQGFRWTEAAKMQSVEAWLQANGVTVQGVQTETAT